VFDGRKELSHVEMVKAVTIDVMNPNIKLIEAAISVWNPVKEAEPRKM
jgi:hypothetical protein